MSVYVPVKTQSPLRARCLALLALLALMPTAGRAQATRPSVSAVRIATPVHVDGRLDEAGWGGAPVATDFTQHQPDDGEPATQRTEVRFLYDAEALYVGARMYDSEGRQGIVSRLFRRDGDFQSDNFQLIIDTFHDHLGRAFFSITPAGVKGDALGLGGAEFDDSWDPVWDAATEIDSLGWTAELRIPFDQLRFPRETDQTWGLQMWRLLYRRQEFSMWTYWPSNETGGAAFFGHLEGLEIEAAPAKGEFLPYVVASDARLGTADASSPFYRKNKLQARVGADFKYLLTSNLTMTGTVNPDFGQVEVDPAVVNLTAFETYFAEKRPFFVEGGGYFQFGGMSCMFCDAAGLGLFYSRRIGRAPQGANLTDAAGAYADVPENATILGAAKITGRTASGWSVGVLDAVTAREQARIAAPDGTRFDTEVEPLANYFVGRVAKDYLGGDLQVRGLATSVVRDTRNPALAAQLNRHAEGGGLEAEWWFDQRRYRWKMTVAASQVAGDSAAVLRVQRSSAHYFQRPDRHQGSNGLFTSAWDPGLTAMRGWGFENRLSRESGDWLWELNAGGRSPGFEVNDLAYLRRADYLWLNANLARRRTTPSGPFRQYFFLAGSQRQYNFDGDVLNPSVRVFANVTLLNYWDIEAVAQHFWETPDDQLTRGGPVVRYPARDDFGASLTTDTRKAVSASVSMQLGANAEGARHRQVTADITVRPSTNVNVSVSPLIDRPQATAQYVTAVADATARAFGGTRYVFADLTQRAVGMNVRLGLAFTPNLTFDLFMQPLIASGAYSNFKEFAQPREMTKRVYGTDTGRISLADGRYTVDPDGAGSAAPFTFANPDFNFRSLRGNAVLRWEFKPGSTFYFAWTHARSGQEGVGTLDLSRDMRALWRAPSDNVFLVKVSYWIGT